jgi:uncharacterized protein (TIGR03437 family)
MIGVSARVAGEVLPFQFVQAFPPDQPNFLVVSPSIGVTPALLWVGLNRDVVPYLPAGAYAIGLQFAPPDQPCPLFCAGTVVTLRLTSGLPVVTSVVNAATQRPGISPGAIVSILGTNLGTPPISAKYDSAGFFPISLGNSAVTFNGVTAPLLYVSTTRIDTVVPYSLAGEQTTEIVVTHNRLPSAAVSAPIQDTSPGIFTATGDGHGHPILNQDGTPNSPENPALKGSILQIWATGAGVWNRNPRDGSVVLSSLIDFSSSGEVYMRPAATVSLTIGGQPAEILYAGPAPYEVSGKLQVNAVVPQGIESGAQPIVLRVVERDNEAQKVTVSVE